MTFAAGVLFGLVAFNIFPKTIEQIMVIIYQNNFF